MAKKKDKVQMITNVYLDDEAQLVALEDSLNCALMDPRDIAALITAVRNYREAEEREKQAQADKEIHKITLVALAEAYPGLRGLQTMADSLRTLVFPTAATHEYDRDLLKKSLGPAYPELVKETVLFEIMLSDEKKQRRLRRYLKGFFDGNDYKKLVKEDMSLKVDEERLEKLIADNKIRLLKGAKSIKKKAAWNVKTVQVK